MNAHEKVAEVFLINFSKRIWWWIWWIGIALLFIGLSPKLITEIYIGSYNLISLLIDQSLITPPELPSYLLFMSVLGGTLILIVKLKKYIKDD